MRNIGFSTGALAYGDFSYALEMLAPSHLPCIELSALRISEIRWLIESIPTLDVDGYRYISIHAPSSFAAEEESWLADLLYIGVPEHWPIVMHPDAIHNFSQWKRFGRRIAIENMDRRKSCGRSVRELRSIFEQLPEAGLCFDIGHARQFDSSMTEAFLILKNLQNRLVQLHLSEVNSESQHEPISFGAILAFQQIAFLVPESVPIILESRVNAMQISKEVQKAEDSLKVLVAHQRLSFT